MWLRREQPQAAMPSLVPVHLLQVTEEHLAHLTALTNLDMVMFGGCGVCNLQTKAFFRHASHGC